MHRAGMNPPPHEARFEFRFVPILPCRTSLSLNDVPSTKRFDSTTQSGQVEWQKAKRDPAASAESLQLDPITDQNDATALPVSLNSSMYMSNPVVS